MKLVRFFIWNVLTRNALKNDRVPKFLSDRLKTMSADLSFILTVFFPLILVIMFPCIIFFTSHNGSLDYIFFLLIIPTTAMNFCLLNKDCVYGQSAAKLMYGYKVVNKNNEEASDFQCMLRNCTFLIWPIEVLLASINKERRLGDFIARTKLVRVPAEDPAQFVDRVLTRVSLSTKTIFVGSGLSLLFVFLSYIPNLISR